MKGYTLRLASQQLRKNLTNISHASRTRAASTQASSSKLSRIESRLPRFLQRYVQPLRNAPVSHITAFLVLHELTAVVPLFGLTAVFHYTDWLPPYISEGAWVKQGVDKFGKYLRKKGWLGDEEGGGARWFGRGEGGVRIVAELATAYAITKALLPLRLIFSVWATPWFARATMLPIWNATKRLLKRTPKANPSPSAGTGAVGAGVVPKTKAAVPGDRSV